MIFVKGQIGTMRGRHQSLEARLKMSIAKKGKPSSRKGIPTGKTPWNKGIPMSDELRKKVSDAKGRTGKEIPCNYCGKLKYYRPFKISHNKTKRFFCCAEHQKLYLVKENNPAYKGNDISYKQKHTRIFAARGRAIDYDCAMKDKTCKGLNEWASISHKAKADIRDFIPLCRSHHRRYDIRNK